MQENDPDELAKQVQHWRSTAQRHEKTARDNSKAAERLRAIEDANKTELQKATEARESAERERDAALTASSRMMAAAAHNLDPELIDFLGDGTSEEISARAEQLAGIIEANANKLAEQKTASQGNGRQPQTGTRRPVETMRPGSAPASTGASTPDQMFRQLLNGSDSD
jgi:hypothetical protein